jgi:NAD+ diphosphatase
MTEFKSALVPPSGARGPSWWFIFSDRKLLLTIEDVSFSIPLLENGPGEITFEPLRTQYLGLLGGTDCYAAELPKDLDPPGGMVFKGLRALFGSLGEPWYRVAFLAAHLVEWDRTTLFCGQCGAENCRKSDTRAKECPKCGLLTFPRISPAVIVSVERDDKLLLARSNRFVTGFYSVLAGFVEPGETIEETVRREIKEEVGIDVRNIRYFGSQPWPFPDSLMIGFTAEYEKGEILIDAEEIVDAGWYGAHELPQIPDKLSIARRLIDWFVEKQKKSEQ